MNQFSPVPLTTAGRPIFLDEEEVEIKSFDNVELYESLISSGKERLNSTLLFPELLLLQLMLTNVRLIMILQNPSKSLISWGIFLKAIRAFNDPNDQSFFKRSKRVRLYLQHDTAAANEKDGQDLDIRFLEGNKEEFMELLRRALERKSWEFILTKPKKGSEKGSIQATADANQREQPGFSVKNAGIGGIIRRQEQTVQNMDQLTKVALSDLNHLIDKAREVVSTVQRYAQTIQDSSGATLDKDETVSETSTQINERYEIENIMQDIGIISPVTKLSSGRSYHQQLAREICDVLLTKQRLIRLGGMITLTDLYCLINKLHGTDLVSPQDLLKASECVESLGLGIKLRTFPKSQVKVLQLAPSNGLKGGDWMVQDSEFTARIIDLIRNNAYLRDHGTTISEIVQSMNLSFLIVKELLQILEFQEQLCRDDSMEGVRFFFNEFPALCAKYCHFS